MMNTNSGPSQIARYDTVVRLSCLKPRTNDVDRKRFADAWQAMAEQSAATGMLYRELNRQVPEWSQLAGREMDYPIDAQFLEYVIAEPNTDLSQAPVLPSEFRNAFDVTEDLHTVAFRLTRENVLRESEALMFNLFEIDGPAGMEQGFLMDWPPRGEFKMREDATVATMLHQRMLPAATIKAFNRAEVTSAAAYAEGIDRFEAAFPRKARKAAQGDAVQAGKPPIRSHLGLFEMVGRVLRPEPLAPDTTADMLAVVMDVYGPPEVLQARRAKKPEPGPGQLRVRVKASSINPLDVKMRSGEVGDIYPSWFPDVPGYSIAGVVDALGAGVTDRKVGDEVYGINNPIVRHGYAEFVVGPARFFYPKPRRLGWATAAAVPSVFATAYGALFLRSNLQAGQTVLIHGGAGVIGSCAVQLATQAGAHVIATASRANLERVRALGAEVVVDYKTQRFEDVAKDVDLVLDTVGGETRERSWAVVRRGGTLASLLPPAPDPQTAAQYGIHAFLVHGHPDISEIMAEMTQRLEDGRLDAPEIAATFPLAAASAAHAAFEKTSPKGRIALTVD